LSFFLALGVACLLALPAARAADPASEAPPAPPATYPQVRVSTSMGDFNVELLTDRSPLTVANFVRYIKEGFYTGTIIHRVVGNFVIQGGGHDSADYKLKPTHDPIFNESGNGMQNKRGTVGLARSGSPHSGNSQFYINLVDNPDLDPLPTRWGYAVFGRVVSGMDVVDRIGTVATGAIGPFKSDAPLKPVIIQKIEVVDPTKEKEASKSGAPAQVKPRTETILSPQ
jgi:cyclophilin family peptidyl-prolyl cis-trans isomerase